MIDAEIRGAWDVLVEKLQSFVGRRVPPSDVDDVVQEVLLRIHKRGSLVGDDRFGGWVYQVARNAIADHYRRQARPLPAQSSAQGDGDDDVDELGLLACVAPFVARLPSPYREAIASVEIDCRTQQVAAEAAGVSLSGMKSRVQRGRRMLRAMFEECCALTFDVRGRVVEAHARRACACSTTSCRGAV